MSLGQSSEKCQMNWLNFYVRCEYSILKHKQAQVLVGFGTELEGKQKYSIVYYQVQASSGASGLWYQAKSTDKSSINSLAEE